MASPGEAVIAAWVPGKPEVWFRSMRTVMSVWRGWAIVNSGRCAITGSSRPIRLSSRSIRMAAAANTLLIKPMLN